MQVIQFCSNNHHTSPNYFVKCGSGFSNSEACVQEYRGYAKKYLRFTSKAWLGQYITHTLMCAKYFYSATKFLLRMLLSAKKVLELSLFIAFVFLYVLPALKRLERRRTIVLESRKKTNGVVAPSITIVERCGSFYCDGCWAKSRDRNGIEACHNGSKIAPRNDLLKAQCENF